MQPTNIDQSVYLSSTDFVDPSEVVHYLEDKNLF